MRISGTAVDSQSSPRRSAPSVHSGASVVPDSSTSRPSLGAEAHPGGRRHCEGAALARPQQVVQERVAQLADVGLRTCAVDHPADLTRRTVRQRDGETAVGKGGCVDDGRLRRPSVGPSRCRASTTPAVAAGHPVPQRCSRSRRPGRGTRGVALAEALPQVRGVHPEAVEPGAPVAGRPAYSLEVARGASPAARRGGAPVGDVRERRRAPAPVQWRRGSRPVLDTTCSARSGRYPARSARVRRRPWSVPCPPAALRRADAVTSYDVEGARGPRVGDEEAGCLQGLWRPGVHRPVAVRWRRRTRRRPGHLRCPSSPGSRGVAGPGRRRVLGRGGPTVAAGGCR